MKHFATFPSYSVIRCDRCQRLKWFDRASNDNINTNEKKTHKGQIVSSISVGWSTTCSIDFVLRFVHRNHTLSTLNNRIMLVLIDSEWLQINLQTTARDSSSDYKGVATGKKINEHETRRKMEGIHEPWQPVRLKGHWNWNRHRNHHHSTLAHDVDMITKMVVGWR